MKNVLQLVFEAAHYGFIIKAIIVGSLIAVSSSFLGIFLVLTRQSMIGDGLGHVSFATIALALLLDKSPLLVSLPLVILSSILILKLNEKASIYGDAAIGLISAFAVALGVLISSLAKGFNVDLFSYLFGSILIINKIDVILSIILSALVIILVLLFYNDLFAVTYDKEFAKTMGLKAKRLNYLLAILTSITVVLGIRVVGIMLISSMIIFPTVSALQISRGFKDTIIISTGVSVLSVLIGTFASYIFNLPTGATIVIINGVFFLGLYGVKKLKIV